MIDVTKNQHYVPQFLLRNFSTQRKRTYRINVLDAKRSQFRQNQNIADICSQNYFYDKDNEVERLIERTVEAPASSMIEHLCAFSPTVSSTPSREIARFFSVQLSRTAEALDQAQMFVNGVTKTMFREMARLNDFDENAAERLRLVPSEPRTLASLLALNGCIAWLLVRDLEQHLIVNKTSRDFVISDHPVVHVNRYLFGSKSIATGSLAVAGAQLFLPISPARLLCLYDSRVYKYGHKKGRISYIEDVEVVDAINALQIRNGAQALMFRDPKDLEDVSRLHRAWKKNPLWEYRSLYNPAQKNAQGELRSQHAVSKVQLPPKVDLSFAKIKNSVRRRAVVDVDRVPETVAFFDRIMEESRR